MLEPHNRRNQDVDRTNRIGKEKNTKEFIDPYLEKYPWRPENRISKHTIDQLSSFEPLITPKTNLFPAPSDCRTLGYTDSHTLAKIEAACFKYPWSASKIEAFLRFRKVLAIGVMRNKMLDGFITGRIVHNGLKITSIAVFPHARRLGLATKLFNSLVADAGNRNAFNKPSSEKLISTVIHEENNAAIEFFCKLGFKAKSVEQGCFYSDSRDGYLMTRKKDL